MIAHAAAVLWVFTALAAVDLEVYPGGEMCPNWESANSAKQAYIRAIASEQAGSPETALSILKKDSESGCFRDGPSRTQFYETYIRLARAIATRAEASGNYDAAIGAFFNIRQPMLERYISQALVISEIDRLRMAGARARTADYDVQNSACAEFSGSGQTVLLQQHGSEAEHASRMQVIEGYLKELRSNAQTQGNRVLDEEQSAFSAQPAGVMGGTLPLLERARAWMQLARSDRLAVVTQRAISRGDALAALDATHRLELALDYYQFADSQSHQQQVRAKAKKLGDTSLSRNQYTTASEYYQIADLEDLAEEVLERGEAEKEAAEDIRQERFEQEQDDLESELDL